jgi:hypothetical protein
MAGLGGLASFIQYQGQLQQQEQAKQQQQMQLQAFQQAQQDRQRQQAAMAAAGNALPQLLAGGQVAAQPQMPPPPQPPAPGQASQPAQQPMPQAGGGAPLPPGQPGAQQAQRPPLPPFRPMPTTPPQAAAPQGAIPAPPQPAQAAQGAPQGGPLSIESAIKVLKDQGLEGADLMAGLQQLQPVLDTQAKLQSAQLQAQFNNAVKLEQLQTQKDSLQARIDAAKQASEDRRLSIQEREQAHADSMGMQRQLLNFRIEEAKQKHAGDPDAKLDPETVKLLAQQAYSGDTSVYQNLGRGVQGAQNIVAIRKEVARMRAEKGETGADQAAQNVAFGGEKAGARVAATASTKMSQAADEASQLADQALDVSRTFSRTNAPTVNAGLNTLRKQGGDPQVSQFQVAINGFKNTYSRAISPTGTPTVHDKQHADELFSLDQSPAQFEASIAQAKKEMAAAIAAPGHVQAAQRARISGKPAEGSGAIPQGWSVTEH